MYIIAKYLISLSYDPKQFCPIFLKLSGYTLCKNLVRKCQNVKRDYVDCSYSSAVGEQYPES